VSVLFWYKREIPYSILLNHPLISTIMDVEILELNGTTAGVKRGRSPLLLVFSSPREEIKKWGIVTPLPDNQAMDFRN
jgi:hypothetical protein